MDAAQTPSSPADIIRALGGASELSRHLAASRSAVANWMSDGIPAKYWPAIARHALTAQRPDITIELLERAARPVRQTAASSPSAPRAA